MSSTSDSESDDERLDFHIESSLKRDRTIIHEGIPSNVPATFATISKHVKWPDELWGSGTLIYSMENSTNTLGLPESPNDKILRFDSKFESGNLMYAYHLGSNSYHLILEYDHNHSGSCQWFYFELKNVKADIKYQFYISGFHKNSGVFKTGSKIFWYSVKQYQKSGISWSRGGSNYGYNVTSKQSNNKRATLQFQIKFPFDDDTVYLCYALPYTYTYLKQSISNWKSTAQCSFTHSTLCKTLGGNECPILTLENPNSSIPQSKKDCILLTARIHPGESNGSYVMHGLIDFLTSSHPAAELLLENHIVKIIPMTNIDGVIEGYYRIGLAGSDLNRVWMNPNPAIHPVICAIKDLVKDIQEERKIAAYIDFHGHSRLHGTFAYGCPNDKTELIIPTSDVDTHGDLGEEADENSHKDQDDDLLSDLHKESSSEHLNENEPNHLTHIEKIYPRMVAYLSDAFSWGNCVFSIPKERKAASRIVMRKEFNIIQSFTVESSFGGIINGPRAGYLYDEIIWKELGAKCGEGLFHLLTESSLYNLCKREIYFISPQHISPAKNAKAATKDQKNAQSEGNGKNSEVQFAPVATASKRDTDLGMMPINRTRNNQQPILLKVRHPTTFLTTNSRIISSQSPGYAAPKWAQMQFVPR